MGKIRVKSFGDQEEEAKQARKLQNRKDAKQAKKEAEEKAEEVIVEPAAQGVIEEKKLSGVKSASGRAKKQKKKNFRSQKYQGLVATFDKTKIYSLSEALEFLVKLQRGKFDETVELHINTLTSGISGNVTLPYGSGKKTKVAIATDALIAEIEKGIINFDILVATPSMMPKLARVAKVLGPKGLMPNPKNGTITEKPEEVAKKYEGGQVNFKTEAKSPIIHLTVGKMSFGAGKLSENLDALIGAVKKSNIISVTLKSTMSPGIKIKV